jgi:hypothetical protein
VDERERGREKIEIKVNQGAQLNFSGPKLIFAKFWEFL